MTFERQTEPTGPGTRQWIHRHRWGLAACAVGLIAIAVAGIALGRGASISTLPNPMFTSPLLAVAVGLAIASFVRREGAIYLPIIGVALAGAAMALGWVLAVVGILLVAALIVVILQEVM